MNVSPVGNTASRGQRADRRPARGVRHAARAGGGEPLHRARVPPRGRDHPRDAGAGRRARARRPVRDLRGIGRASRPGCASSSRPATSPSSPSWSASSPRASIGLGRYLGLGAQRSVEHRARARRRHAEELRAAAAAGRLRERPRRSGRRPRRSCARRSPARPSRGPSARSRSPRARTGRRRSPPRSTASRPATSGAGATRASGSRWCARPPTRRRCSRASPRCRRSSR